MLDNNEYVPYEFEPVEEAEPPRKRSEERRVGKECL